MKSRLYYFSEKGVEFSSRQQFCVLQLYFNYTSTILQLYFNYTSTILQLYFNYTSTILQLYFNFRFCHSTVAQLISRRWKCNSFTRVEKVELPEIYFKIVRC